MKNYHQMTKDQITSTIKNFINGVYQAEAAAAHYNVSDNYVIQLNYGDVDGYGVTDVSFRSSESCYIIPMGEVWAECDIEPIAAKIDAMITAHPFGVTTVEKTIVDL